MQIPKCWENLTTKFFHLVIKHSIEAGTFSLGAAGCVQLLSCFCPIRGTASDSEVLEPDFLEPTSLDCIPVPPQINYVTWGKLMALFTPL